MARNWLFSNLKEKFSLVNGLTNDCSDILINLGEIPSVHRIYYSLEFLSGQTILFPILLYYQDIFV